ncbi:MAG: hypothetical protein KGJ36_00130 [Acidobacteriota bacterium]|nr:hypothetical protein [Acidobacteriota bacterium]
MVVFVGAFTHSVPYVHQVCFGVAAVLVLASFVVEMRNAAPQSWQDAELTGGIMGSLYRFGMRNESPRGPGG